MSPPSLVGMGMPAWWDADSVAEGLGSYEAAGWYSVCPPVAGGAAAVFAASWPAGAWVALSPLRASASALGSCQAPGRSSVLCMARVGHVSFGLVEADVHHLVKHWDVGGRWEVEGLGRGGREQGRLATQMRFVGRVSRCHVNQAERNGAAREERGRGRGRGRGMAGGEAIML